MELLINGNLIIGLKLRYGSTRRNRKLSVYYHFEPGKSEKTPPETAQPCAFAGTVTPKANWASDFGTILEPVKLPALRAEVTAPARNKRRGFLLLSFLSSVLRSLTRAPSHHAASRFASNTLCPHGRRQVLVVSYPYPPSNVSATPGVYGRILAQTASLISELTMPSSRRLV